MAPRHVPPDKSPSTHESPLQTLLTLPLNSYSPLTPHARSMVSSVQGQSGDGRSDVAVVDNSQENESPTREVEEGPLSATLRQIGLRKSVKKWRLAADTAQDDDDHSNKAAKFTANRKSIASPGVFAAFQQQQRQPDDQPQAHTDVPTAPLVVKRLERLNSHTLKPSHQHEQTETLTAMPSPEVVRPTTSRGLSSAHHSGAHSFSHSNAHSQSRVSRSHSLLNGDSTQQRSPVHCRSKSTPIPSPPLPRRPDGWGGLMPPSGWFADAETHRGPLVSTPTMSASQPLPKKNNKKVVRFASLLPSLRDVLTVVQEDGESNGSEKTPSPILQRPPPYSASALFTTPLVDIEKSSPSKEGKVTRQCDDGRASPPPPRTRTVKAKWLYFCIALIIVSMVLAIAFAVSWSNVRSASKMQNQGGNGGTTTKSATDTSMTQQDGDTTTTNSATDTSMTTAQNATGTSTTQLSTFSAAPTLHTPAPTSGHPTAVSSALNQAGSQR